jgi:hypothetical protein
MSLTQSTQKSKSTGPRTPEAGQNIIERGSGVLPVPPGVVVQLCLAFRREM